MNRRDVIAGMALTAAGTVLRAAPAGDPVVETTFGKVRGQRGVYGGYKFFCVPYGASTGGAGRFMPPKRSMFSRTQRSASSRSRMPTFPEETNSSPLPGRCA